MHTRLARLHLRDHFRRADTRLLDDFDDLTTRACEGDRRALGVIAIVFSGTLTDAAHARLLAPDPTAAECVRTLFEGIAAGLLRFDPDKERALDWMKRLVREIARHRDEGLTLAWGSW